jgi:hypothetical protein
MAMIHFPLHRKGVTQNVYFSKNFGPYETHTQFDDFQRNRKHLPLLTGLLRFMIKPAIPRKKDAKKKQNLIQQ